MKMNKAEYERFLAYRKYIVRARENQEYNFDFIVVFTALVTLLLSIIITAPVIAQTFLLFSIIIVLLSLMLGIKSCGAIIELLDKNKVDEYKFSLIGDIMEWARAISLSFLFFGIIILILNK